MRRNIQIPLNSRGLALMKKELEKEKARILWAQTEIVKRLLERGVMVMEGTLDNHVHTGETIDSIKVDIKTGAESTTGTLTVGSKAILFLEFGAGLIGYGHPRASEFGFGPGTYPGNGNWDNPGGWWYPTDDPALSLHVDKYGQMWGFSTGTRPLMPMHTTVEWVKRNVEAVTREVLG